MSQPLLPSAVQSAIAWLRQGYPDDVPPPDYIPLLALLARRLPPDQVQAVVDELRRAGNIPISDTDIADTISALTQEPPRANDIDRVRRRLGEHTPAD